MASMLQSKIGVLLVAVAMFHAGCATTQPGPSIVRDGLTLKQSGIVEVFQTADGIEVSYPERFGAIPQLTLRSAKGVVSADDVELIDQQCDHFTVRWKHEGGLGQVNWQAEGKAGGR